MLEHKKTPSFNFKNLIFWVCSLDKVSVKYLCKPKFIESQNTVSVSSAPTAHTRIATWLWCLLMPYQPVKICMWYEVHCGDFVVFIIVVMLCQHT
jgi:hypothetical protein